jgi:hypothetical protein
MIVDSVLRSVAFVACVTSAATADAADVFRGRRPEVVLEGNIVAGDCAKLKKFIGEEQPDSVYLASPGGNVAEAMEIGRLVRALRLRTVVPSAASSGRRNQWAVDHKLKNANANYTCASACFFVFVAGVDRSDDAEPIFDFDPRIPPYLGIHRPYLSETDLRGLSANQAIAVAGRARTTVENYLREMGVLGKYVDQMFSVPKDEIRWVGAHDFDADFRGVIPELRDWLTAKCGKRMEISAGTDKPYGQLTAAEKSIVDRELKHNREVYGCTSKALFDLRSEALEKIYLSPSAAEAPLCPPRP